MEQVQIEQESFFKISNSDSLRPFFMSIVSNSNHWMFISSNGGLTAGRKNSQYSLFPYYTDDKITESADITGSKSVFRVKKGGKEYLWEPFSDRMEGTYKVTRNLYKNIYGNKILFEEINHDLELTYSYQWNSSNVYGFVKKSKLVNDSSDEVNLTVLDGIQNILPYGVGSDLQNAQSNLVDAYKRSELLKESGLGIYALSAIIVDKAEPSEALKANIAWSLGLDNTTHLLSSLQLKNFRRGISVQEETDVKAEKGAYFNKTDLSLAASSEKEWMTIANVNQNHTAIAEISKAIQYDNDLARKVNQDIALGTEKLIQLNAASDGLQLTEDQLRDTRHFSNTLFNIMRGGIFDNNYQIEKWDFKNYLRGANKQVYKSFESTISELPDVFSLSKLKETANKGGDNNFRRLCLEYLPLKFSRRHGDPSRPWNVFSINTHSELDGSKILDYEGNWRDIFQNWEALALSYPEFIECMIHKFLNATTFDGYNPYRVTKGGFDWETIEPDDPWSYIGYWGDHQIIYLLKFLEIAENHSPGRLENLFNEDIFVYANVPYKIKAYSQLLKHPKDTIDFDDELDADIRQRRTEFGADGALLSLDGNEIYQVNFIEKILATVLAKLSNFIPEGGIWMNTQRPEWNDANNALVGNGVSMVTLYYLRRFLNFFRNMLSSTELKEVAISKELLVFLEGLSSTFKAHQSSLAGDIDDKERKSILDGIGQAGSDYRLKIYGNTFSGDKGTVSIEDLSEFVELSIQYCEHSIRANKRADDLYHAYNLMTVDNSEEISIAYLSEMLEGQVAVLSSGYLNGVESLTVLDALKSSALFREDQYSYLLYPNKDLPRFAVKNNIPKERISQSDLLQEFSDTSDTRIIEKDINGNFHFNGNFKNAGDLQNALNGLNPDDFTHLTEKEKESILQLFETVFNHKAFTGRSGTFFGYEGLGSIYWHMVSKLQLAVQECCLKAIEDGEEKETIGRLLEHYYEINEGIGVHKSPELYGAFPTDPYSHTPQGKGAQQPGMTGQVKEDILSRFGELGVFVKEGRLCFQPDLLRSEELLTADKSFIYRDVNGVEQKLELNAGSLCFTYCQVPVVYSKSETEMMKVVYNKGEILEFEHPILDVNTSKKVFARSGEINRIIISIEK
ncbi:hypothetical protein [Muriicola sp. Z0-33]|uniref:hypothetical protein n=1 Tax=Muriicola sp. Z0-33 TaxID=2816957 RepID=UPI00223850C0|nr:hypothetical protein [Muriicola sp. Z0-33]